MKFKIFMITLILFCLAATTTVIGAVTPSRFDSVNTRKGIKVNYGIDIGTYLNVAGTSAFTGNVTFSGNITTGGVNKMIIHLYLGLILIGLLVSLIQWENR